MPIREVLILAAGAFILYLFVRGPARGWLISITSILCLFWLQPPISIRYVGFWLPVITLWITAFVWLVTLPKGTRPERSDGITLAVMIALVFGIALTRYAGGAAWLTDSLLPTINRVAVGLAGGLLVLWLVWWVGKRAGEYPAVWMTGSAIVLILLLAALKSPALSELTAKGARMLARQDPTLASAFDIRWLGFSYISFRLLHVLRDRLSGKLGAYDLRTFVNYVIFFPSVVAGPIDRIQHFAADYRKTVQPAVHPDVKPPSSPALLPLVSARIFWGRLAPWSTIAADENLIRAAQFLVIGLFKKFVLADTLALVALNPTNAAQVQGAGWLWLLTYGYAFQIFFDFAGYTDIAIGLGLLLGVRLPDNFNSPYLKPNLSLFWNSWHMSLTNWLRMYLFNPLVRALRSRKMPAVSVLFIGQITTMIVIGLWHGITWNFVLWGLWHGLGQFVQNRWSDWVKPWFGEHPLPPLQARLLRWISIALTFQYVTLGWVWFVLPTPAASVSVLTRLFGFGAP